MTLAFVDCETIGLDPDRHEIWELAIIKAGDEHAWQLPVDLTRADPAALRFGHFYDRRRALAGSTSVARLLRVRYPSKEPEWQGTSLTVADHAETVAVLLDGAHIVGANPAFDVAFLSRWLRAHGQAATWDYHLVDVEALVAGRLRIEPPWNSGELSQAVGVDPADYDRHTALGDARWVAAIYSAVMDGEPPESPDGH